jgi:hypothetical protein
MAFKVYFRPMNNSPACAEQFKPASAGLDCIGLDLF